MENLEDSLSYDYDHRLNPDGDYVSVCLRCYLTVASAPTEADLLHDELLHDLQCLRRRVA